MKYGILYRERENSKLKFDNEHVDSIINNKCNPKETEVEDDLLNDSLIDDYFNQKRK